MHSVTLSGRSIVASVCVVVLAVALLVGVRWASGVRAFDPGRDDARPMTWPGHQPVFGHNGDRVGWTAINGGVIDVPLPSSYTSADPLNPVSVGVSIVYSDGGKPIGIFGERGFQRGVLQNGTELKPAVRKQIIDDAVANIIVQTTVPGTAP